MSTELTDVKDFIRPIVPFAGLPDAIVSQLVKHMSICYVRKNEKLPPVGINEPMLFILRKGALGYFDKNNELLGKFGEGDLCTAFCNTSQDIELTVVPDEDTLLYAIEYADIMNICTSYPHIAEFFTQSSGQKLSQKVAELNEQAIVSSTLMNTSINDFYHSPAVTIEHDQTIVAAAKMMTELNFSCLLVLKEGDLVGIVTDKDLRRRCVAQGLSLDLPIANIMTDNLQLIDVGYSAYDALIKMTSSGIHHLPVTKHGQLAGMVTVTDLMKQEGLNAVNMSSMIGKANSIDELAKIAELLPKLQISMVKLGTTADNIGKNISAITGAFTRKLITMAKKKFGPEPVPFAWVAAGSQARQEQSVHSDQDNGIIINDALTDEDDIWFKKLATFVSDGLEKCGYEYCPGNVMATNDKWRKSQSTWQRYFDKWVRQPEPLALMNSSIFFDLTTVYGDESLLEDIRLNVLKQTKSNTLFIAHLSSNAIKLRPPLGFFRDFVLTDNGNHKKTLDLKHNGIAPIVDLARIYALAEGIQSVNTLERLSQAAGTPSLSKSSAASLISAYEFLSMLKVEHQAKQLTAGVDMDNYLEPKELSRLEREHLKDAFKVIKTMQSTRQITYS